MPLVVQLTDDEKFLFKQDLKLEEVSWRMAARSLLVFDYCRDRKTGHTKVQFCP